MAAPRATWIMTTFAVLTFAVDDKCAACYAVAEKPRNHLDMKNRLNSKGQREGKVIDYRWIQPEAYKQEAKAYAKSISSYYGRFELPKRDLGLTRQMLDEGLFWSIYSRVVKIRQGEARGVRFMKPYLEELVRVLARVTFVISEEPDALKFCRDNNLATVFIDLLQSNGLDNAQMFSAMALENLSQELKNLTELPAPGFCASIFPCFRKQPVITGLCRLHRGHCSLRDTSCLLEGQAVEKLVALLDHTNENVVEAVLAAISTLLDDGVDIEQGVMVLTEAEGIRPILDVLIEKRTEKLRSRAVWAVERLLRTDDIA